NRLLMKLLQKDFFAILLIIIIINVGLFSSCRKHPSLKPQQPSNQDTFGISTTTDEDSLKYLMYNIMQKSFVNSGRDTSYDLPTYYWYNQVPSFSPFSTQYANADSLLALIKTYPKWNGQTVDRYSFLDRTGQIAGQIQNGVVDGNFMGLGSKGSFGLEVTYVTDNQNNSHLVVLYADKNSPAGQAGIQRGWEITSVNGNSNMAYDGPSGPNVTRIENAIYNSNTVTLTLLNLDGSSVTTTLNAAQYDINPILFDTIYVRNNKKIGYFVFYIFSSVEDDNGAPTNTKTILDNEFDKLSSAGINDLIVDLRYNEGGAVTTAEYLDSAIAPASAQGKVMYQYSYNDKLTQVTSQLGLENQVLFPGGGSMHLDHVFFIVSRSTASASELTLNNLKPYMDVKLVGDTTYGKPVGFIDFTINDYPNGSKKYLADLYAIDFATKNANGVGDYFNGIPPDVEAIDYVNISWGDPSDDNLSKIFNYITTGSFLRTYSQERLVNKPNLLRVSPEFFIRSNQFNGMIDYRLGKELENGLRNMRKK
ncbi:MAG: S41 family peptidase, partial [Chitinophagaceae bacterium]